MKCAWEYSYDEKNGLIPRKYKIFFIKFIHLLCFIPLIAGETTASLKNAIRRCCETFQKVYNTNGIFLSNRSYLFKKIDNENNRVCRIMNIKCFVAMSFKEELDKVYEDCIKVAVESFGIEPRRVDRITHNDRIDSMIRQEIEEADFVIADVTFERPSVYWEAGFAERKSPVIYTCRKDHFDKESQYVVHFDLQNANIIIWDSSNLDKFRQKLSERIEFVLQPIHSRLKENDKIQQSKEIFRSLSTTEKESQLREKQSEVFLKLGYKSCHYIPYWPKFSGRSEYKHIDNTMLFFFPGFQYFINPLVESGKIDKYEVFKFFDYDMDLIEDSKRKIMNQFQELLTPGRGSKEIFSDKDFSSTEFIQKVILFSIKDNLDIDLFLNEYPSWRRGYGENHVYDPNVSIEYYKELPFVKHEILFIDNVSSLMEYRDLLIKTITSLEEFQIF